ncbi:MAG: hypothetical protein NVS2B1_15230 [Bradyrhizobium sp.]
MRAACLSALEISPQACVAFGARHSWEASAQAFIEHITKIPDAVVGTGTLPLAAGHAGFVA